MRTKEKVFLSHSHADKPFVRMVSEDLRSSGISIWLDELEMGPGDSLVGRIGDALQHALCIIAFLSPNTVNSKWVKKELALGLTVEIESNHLMVIPTLLPGATREDIPFMLRDKLYADFREPARYNDTFQVINKVLRPGKRKANTVVRNLELNSERMHKLVEIAKNIQMRGWVIAYLTEVRRDDPVERYWSYTALGFIGGPEVLEILQQAAKDTDEFARNGAVKAYQLLVAESKK